MRAKIMDNGVKLWLSADDTENWADRPGAAWPCSQLSGNRLFTEFDSNGLVDLAVNGRRDADIDSNELSAICADHLAEVLSKAHPCYNVAVGQFVTEPDDCPECARSFGPH